MVDEQYLPIPGSDVPANRGLIWSLAIGACLIVNGALLAGMVSVGNRVIEFMQLHWTLPILLCALVALIVLVRAVRSVVLSVIARADETASAV